MNKLMSKVARLAYCLLKLSDLESESEEERVFEHIHEIEMEYMNHNLWIDVTH